MLRAMDIRDMLLIDRLSLDFAPGLNVLTGETGAGKSILLDCLGFVLGWRGRAELVELDQDNQFRIAAYEGGDLRLWDEIIPAQMVGKRLIDVPDRRLGRRVELDVQTAVRRGSPVVHRCRGVLMTKGGPEPFDWVRRVSIELTARMLATLLDFPYEQRHKLVEWSDIAAASPETTGGLADRDKLFPAVAEVAKAFSGLWHEKQARQQAALLIVGAVFEQGGRHQQAHAELRDADGADGAHLVFGHGGERGRQPAAKPLFWPGRAAPAGLDQPATPFGQAQFGAPVLRQPGADLVTHGGFGGGAHGRSPAVRAARLST